MVVDVLQRASLTNEEDSVLFGAQFPLPFTDMVTAFLAQVETRASEIAVVCGEQALTYAQVDEQSLRLADDLEARGAGRGDVIGIDMPRCSEWVIAMLAALRVGGCYLPLNRKDPEARRRVLLQDAKPRLIIAFDDVQASPIILAGQLAAAEPCGECGADQPAYIMYTSGSTGRPKGVIVSHRNVLRLVTGRNLVPLSPDTRMMQTGAPTFDAVTFEIWGPLLNGGCVIIANDDEILSAVALGQKIARSGANTMWLTSPLFNILASSDGSIFEPLSYLIVGGDVVVRQNVASVMAKCPTLSIVNGYGPTENTTFSTMHRVDLGDSAPSVPIGRPIANSSAYVLNDDEKPVRRGDRGELHVGGAGVALGYLNRPELTETAFVSDPFIQGGTMYRTGDIVYLREDGEIVFVGREDGQIKLRGFRVELPEIEHRLRQHPGVSDVALVYDQAHAGGARLIAYVVAGDMVSDLELRAFLLEALPQHMLPHFIVPLETFPLTSHGKIARDLLPAPEDIPYIGALYAAPTTPGEIKVATIIEGCTGFHGIGLHDSFYDLGVDSLSAARIAVTISKDLGITIPASAVLLNANVAALALHIDSVSPLVAPSAAPNAVRDGSSPRFAFTRQQHPIFIEQMKAVNSVRYNVPVVIDLPHDVDVERLEYAFDELARQRDELRLAMPLSETLGQTVMPPIPVILARSMGSVDAAAQIRPFDLQKGPLWRASLHQSGEGWQLFFDVHHLIADGYTLALIFSDIDRIYRGIECPASTRTLRDASAWQATGEGAALRGRQRVFWESRQWKAVAPEVLPLDYPRRVDRSRRSDSVSFALNAAIVHRCQSLAAENRMTLFEVLGAIYGLFLSDITGESDVTFGVPAHARVETDFVDTYGMLANTVCLAHSVDPAVVFKDYLANFALNHRLSIENQAFGFSDLVEMTDAARTPGRNPLFDSLLAFQSAGTLTVEFLGQPVLLRPLSPGEAMFDLNLQLFQINSGIEAEWEFDTTLFARATVEMLRDKLLGLLQRAADSTMTVTLGELLAPATTEAAAAPAIQFNF